MYRALIQSGSIECDDYKRSEQGVDLYEDDEFVAFVPYENLFALFDETQGTMEERSIL